MALFNKFFFSSSKKKTDNSNNSQNYLCNQFPFDSHQVRILLYRECDARGRRLLFDSSSVQKIDGNESPTIIKNSNNKSNPAENLKNNNIKRQQLENGLIEISNGYGYKHNRPNTSDIATIGEMVFGALAMSFRGTALKLHWLQSPSRVLCSQVFLSPIPGSSCSYLLQHQSSCLSQNNSKNLSPRPSISSEHRGSIDGFSINSFSMPFSVSVNKSLNLLTTDSTTTNPLDVPDQSLEYCKQQSNDITNIGSDSGYTTTSDAWTSRSSYQYSTRSSMGSVLSDPLSTYDSLRKFSLDSGRSSNGVNSSNCIISNSFGNNQSYSMSIQQNQKSSDINLQRRVSRNLRTSFENRNSMSDFVGFISDNYQTATNGGSDGCVTTKYERRPSDPSESRSNPEFRSRGCSGNTMLNIFGSERRSNKYSTRRAKLGLAVCISMSESHEKEMEQFCCEHIALLESMLCRLRASAEYAYLNHKNFLKIMLHAWQKTVQWISDIFTVPRLSVPVWLKLSSTNNKNSKNLSENFMKEFCWLLKTADTKDTNFFISTMVTAILTHHLGWVSTIPVTASNNLNTLSNPIIEFANEQQSNLTDVSKNCPYNALWAQMEDLYGAIGSPPKVSRTIIYGKEKNIIEKFLHILTYFIRCGEVRRNPKTNLINKDTINKYLINKEISKDTIIITQKPKKKIGLTKNSSYHKNLSDIQYNIDETDFNTEIPKMNDIPNVFAFRDSRFIKQELRIGNYQMDTGIESNEMKTKNSTFKDIIKLTVTTPDNVEMPVDAETISLDSCSTTTTTPTEQLTALEAIELQTEDMEIENNNFKKPRNSISEKLNFWKLEPNIKEGLSWDDLEKLQKGVRIINKNLVENKSVNFPQSFEYFKDNSKSSITFGKTFRPIQGSSVKKYTSLSDLITENSVGKSERLTWGIEPVKEIISLEEEKHFEMTQKLVEKQRGIVKDTTGAGKGVLFVLGENEELVNIKKSNEDISSESATYSSEASYSNKKESITCGHHKKHSGVKFNFEQYPQIATNYMKNKNIDLSNCDFERKPLKFDLNNECCNNASCNNNDKIPSTSSFYFEFNPAMINSATTNGRSNRSNSLETCEFCNSCASKIYQTPSNATELEELETDDKMFSINSTTGEKINEKNVISTSNYCSQRRNSGCVPKIVEQTKVYPMSSRGMQLKKLFQKQKEQNQQNSLNNPNLIQLPLPEVGENKLDETIVIGGVENDLNTRTGYIPSLFVGITDHYIPDMVLQGTISQPENWESNLKDDLTLSSHCASLISIPTENVAIVADMEKWEIKIISSQTNILPYTSSTSGPVGMSQLVSTMLETVQVMCNSGISSYECLAFMESKLREIYLQSEALAAFLLATEFCSLKSVTSALNLCENDVPLLLSVASTHTPQVTKKYGISFR